ncbi:MAG: YicC family protein [Rhodobacteraceae bacterium]|nr:YicC family protein [Alphaproteobacteria bacterium]MBT8476713.1 YicC family protein [Alphaproteobacteria bacterium]NNF72278.1 YicC family protein [Paracoccaceae bacterium]NNK66503.1 YicC family protein [Paracoccaceae bacterium]
MTRSMTGFASAEGQLDGWSWSWDLRAVNGRGLDIRLRLPDWIDGLEVPVRAALQKAIGRGNVTLSLRIAREAGEGGLTLDAAGLARTIAMLRKIEDAAADGDLSIAPSSAADILALRGVTEAGNQHAATDALRKALSNDLTGLIADFNAMRDSEGSALADVLSAQIDEIERSVTTARGLVDDRSAYQRTTLAKALARVMEATDGADADRVAQELALIAVKADLAEELDRLDAHVSAARDLLSGDGPKGRKLDFLTQEFNREANTLCSKAQFNELTRVGLDLKHTIDQMREQVQNVE